MIRNYIGALFIRFGMAIIHPEVRRIARNTLLYHVPGGISPEEKAEIEDMKIEYDGRNVKF